MSILTKVPILSAGRFNFAGVKSDGTIAVIGSSLIESDLSAVTGARAVYTMAAPTAENQDNALALGQDETVKGIYRYPYHNGHFAFTGPELWFNHPALSTWDMGAPMPLPAWTCVVGMVVDFFFVCVLKSDGTVDACGWDQYGIMQEVSTSWENIVKISGDQENILGLTADGYILAVGNNSDLRVTGRPSGNGFVDVLHGPNHCMALREDGTVVSWGQDENWYGCLDTTIGSGFYNIKQLAAGWNTSYGLRTDGTVAAVGNNQAGQIDSTQTWMGFEFIAGADYRVIGLRSNGEIVVAGNSYTPDHYTENDLATEAETWSGEIRQPADIPALPSCIQVSDITKRTATVSWEWIY